MKFAGKENVARGALEHRDAACKATQAFKERRRANWALPVGTHLVLHRVNVARKDWRFERALQHRLARLLTRLHYARRARSAARRQRAVLNTWLNQTDRCSNKKKVNFSFSKKKPINANKSLFNKSLFNNSRSQHM